MDKALTGRKNSMCKGTAISNSRPYSVNESFRIARAEILSGEDQKLNRYSLKTTHFVLLFLLLLMLNCRITYNYIALTICQTLLWVL